MHDLWRIKNMKIVILDAKTLGDDIEFSVFNKLGCERLSNNVISAA